MNKKHIFLPAAILAAGAAAVTGAVFSMASVTDSILYASPKRSPETAEYFEKERERLRSLPMETVYMQSFDGLRLAAHYYPAESAKRTIILVHGWHSFWYADFAAITDYLHDTGANLLFIEQRAQGGSEGKYMTFGILERYDVVCWAKKLAEFADVSLPVYLFGISMGATTVLMASGLELPPYVRGIAADCGFTSPEAILRTVIQKRTPLPPMLTEKGAGLHLRLRTGLDYSACSALDAVKNSRTPTVFIHGEKDNFVPCSMGIECYNACAAPKKLFTVPEAGHGMSFLKDPEGYKAVVEEMFEKYDNFNKTEDKTVKKTMKIEGMMCIRCQGRVQKALEAIPVKAEVSYETGLAVVEFEGDVSDAVLKETVEKAGYEVISIE